MNRMRHFRSALLAVALLGCAAAASPEPMRRDAGTGCRFAAPANMGAGAAAWLGDCHEGLAEGTGVIRVTPRAAGPVLFYGDMTGGRPIEGVVERDGLYREVMTPEGERQARDGSRAAHIRVFDVAARGARAAAERFQARGAKPSARFYREQARKLENTLD